MGVLTKSSTELCLCTAAVMAAVPPSASFKSKSDGPLPMAFSISVLPFDAAIMAAVLPEFWGYGVRVREGSILTVSWVCSRGPV